MFVLIAMELPPYVQLVNDLGNARYVEAICTRRVIAGKCRLDGTVRSSPPRGCPPPDMVDDVVGVSAHQASLRNIKIIEPNCPRAGSSGCTSARAIQH